LRAQRDADARRSEKRMFCSTSSWNSDMCIRI
jgi:hypothetical protein